MLTRVDEDRMLKEGLIRCADSFLRFDIETYEGLSVVHVERRVRLAEIIFDNVVVAGDDGLGEVFEALRKLKVDQVHYYDAGAGGLTGFRRVR